MYDLKVVYPHCMCKLLLLVPLFCSVVDNNNVIEDNNLSFPFNSQFIFVHASRHVHVCQCRKFQTH